MAHLDKEGSNNAPGIDESWDPQVLDALLGEDGGTSLKPGHMVCAVEELRDDATWTNRHNSSASASCVVPMDAIRHAYCSAGYTDCSDMSCFTPLREALRLSKQAFCRLCSIWFVAGGFPGILQGHNASALSQD